MTLPLPAQVKVIQNKRNEHLPTDANADAVGEEQLGSLTISKMSKRARSQSKALNSMSYYVEGDWVVVANDNVSTNQNASHTTTATALTFEGMSIRCCKNIYSIDVLNNVSYDQNLDPVYYIPRRLIPIPTSYEPETETDPDPLLANHNHTDTSEVEANNNTQHEVPPIIDLEEGVKYHRFTANEAQSCLANKRILILGDSLLRNVWRALNDIVTGGPPQHDYLRWDGYQKALTSSDVLPQPLTTELAHQLLPRSLMARANDHTSIGVSNVCTVKEEWYIDQLSNTTDPNDIYKCWQEGVKREKNDLRNLHCDACRENNITLEDSWCASSMINILDKDVNGTSDGPGCRDGKGSCLWKKPQTISQFEQLLSNKTYDLVLAGFHNHDIAAYNCQRKDMPEDVNECIEELRKQLIENAQKIASYAEEKNIKLLWSTLTKQETSLIPEQYRQFQQEDTMIQAMMQMASIMRRHGHAVLDNFSIGVSCQKAENEARRQGGHWPSCFWNGVHGSRYVDRMRAHIILNWMCEDTQ